MLVFFIHLGCLDLRRMASMTIKMIDDGLYFLVDWSPPVSFRGASFSNPKQQYDGIGMLLKTTTLMAFQAIKKKGAP